MKDFTLVMKIIESISYASWLSLVNGAFIGFSGANAECNDHGHSGLNALHEDTKYTERADLLDCGDKKNSHCNSP